MEKYTFFKEFPVRLEKMVTKAVLSGYGDSTYSEEGNEEVFVTRKNDNGKEFIYYLTFKPKGIVEITREDIVSHSIHKVEFKNPIYAPFHIGLVMNGKRVW